MCVPTVMNFADQATKERFAGPAIRGEEIWCQLFSEPSGGSDVAAARTKAERAPDGSGDWIINGQKVWTTGAQFSDFGIVIVRTDPTVPKHKGLTMFWIDMKDPAVEVKPIHQMSGGSGFNEVFFTDLRIKDSQRLGGIGEGWKVSLVTLMNERLAVGGGHRHGLVTVHGSGTPDPWHGWWSGPQGQLPAREAGRLVCSGRGPRAHPQPHHDRPVPGQTPGPESSIGKIVSAVQMQDLANEALEMLDQYGIINDVDLAPQHGGFQSSVMFAPVCGSPAARTKS